MAPGLCSQRRASCQSPPALASLQRRIWPAPLLGSPGFLALLLAMHRGESHAEDVETPQTRCPQAETGQRDQAGAGCRADVRGEKVLAPCATQPGGGQHGAVPCPPAPRQDGWDPHGDQPRESRGGSLWSLCKPRHGPRQDWHICSHRAASSPLLLPSSRGCRQPGPADPGMGSREPSPAVSPAQCPVLGCLRPLFQQDWEPRAPPPVPAERSIPPEAAFRPAPGGTGLPHEHRLRDLPSRHTQPQVKPGEKSPSSRAASSIKRAISAAQDVTARVTGNSQRQAGPADCPRGAVQMHMQGKK